MKKLILTISLLGAFFFSQANFNSFNPDSLCSVTIDTIQNGACLQANPTGTAPFTYFWNDSTFASSTCISPISGQYCVTVTDADGCVVTACTGVTPPSCSLSLTQYQDSSVNTSVQLIANFSGTAPYSYVWGTGQVTSTIFVSSSGSYCVTVTDADGCIDFACTTVNLNQNNCSVSVAQVPGTSCVEATPTGTAPFTYLWSDGSTTNQACSNSPFYDTLCVTVMDANGCVSYGCEIAAIVPNCDVVIEPTSGGFYVTASGDSLDQYTYEWSNGTTGIYLPANSSGLFCVTITTSTGCTASDCVSIVLNDEISGVVGLDSLNAGTNGFNDFMVYLIEHDVAAGTLTAIDSVVVSSTPNSFFANFSFTGLGDGDYLVKAAIQPGSDEYDDYLPTYYGDVLYWSDATTFSIPNFNNAFAYINMIAGTNPGGPGFIGGLIIDGANLTSGQVDTRGDGDPLANVNVLLLTVNDEPISHTVTDVDGYFEFPSVAYGTYKVVVEILGKTPGVKMVTLSPDNPSVGVNFEVNETFVTKIEDVLNGASLKVFPNPISDMLNIQVEMKQSLSLNISVTNVLGETLISENERLNEGTQTMQVNLKNLPTGFYFLNLSDGESNISKKIMKK